MVYSNYRDREINLSSHPRALTTIYTLSIYIYIYICVYVFVCIHAYMYVYLYTYVCIITSYLLFYIFRRVVSSQGKHAFRNPLSWYFLQIQTSKLELYFCYIPADMFIYQQTCLYTSRHVYILTCFTSRLLIITS